MSRFPVLEARLGRCIGQLMVATSYLTGLLFFVGNAIGLSIGNGFRKYGPNDNTTVLITERVRWALGNEEADELAKLPISPDRPEHFFREVYDKELPTWISEEEKQRIIFYGHLAEVSKCPPEQVINWTCKRPCNRTRGTKIITVFEHAKLTAFGFIAVNEERREIYVSFRATRTWTNWINNLYAVMTPLSWKYSWNSTGEKPLIHSGFSKTYDSVALNITTSIKPLVKKYVGYSIFAVGHSLGGALATLCGLQLKEILPRNQKVNVITFGAPRVGNAAFVELIRRHFPPKTYIRVINGRDLIVRLGPYFWGYRHAPQEYFIPPAEMVASVKNKDSITAYECDPEVGEDPRCANSILGNSVEDHIFFPSSWSDLELSSRCED